MLTLEEVKQAILAILDTQAPAPLKYEDLTASALSKTLSVKKDLVINALAELEKEGLVQQHDVRLSIYLPDNEKGKVALLQIAKSNLLTYSTTFRVFLLLALLFAAVTYYPYMPTTFNSTTLSEVYREGALGGIVVSTVAGTVGVYFVGKVINSMRRWQIISEEESNIVSRLIERSSLLSVVMIVMYWAGSLYTRYEFRQDIALGLIGLSVAIILGIEQLLKKKDA